MINNEVLKKITYGVYIVGGKYEDRNVGCIANSIMQVTSNNPKIVISINHNNYTHQCIQKTNKFSISILQEQIPQTVIGTFGFSTSKDIDKWNTVEHREIEGLPVLNNSIGYMICKVINTMNTDTHTIFLGEIIQADIFEDIEPMSYAYYHNVIKGKSPKTAPTYIEEQSSNYVCDICGYVYDGDTPFEELPADYKCPICGVGKEHFNIQ